MRRAALLCLLVPALASPALAATYPVSGAWGESAGSEQGAIDCTGKRVITFSGETRTDSRGSVPGYRNKSITPAGRARWRVVDEFTTGQISNGTTTYVLVLIDPAHVALEQQKGGTIKLQRCK